MSPVRLTAAASGTAEAAVYWSGRTTAMLAVWCQSSTTRQLLYFCEFHMHCTQMHILWAVMCYPFQTGCNASHAYCYYN